MSPSYRDRFMPPSYFEGRGGTLRDLAGNDRIAQILMMQGQQQADMARESGARRAALFEGIGADITGGLGAYQAQKEQSKRSQAVDALFSGEGMPDPKSIIKVFGPKDGVDIIKGLNAIHPEAKNNYKDRMEQFRDAARGVKALPPDRQAQGWAVARGSLIQGGVLKPEEAPEEFSPELLEQVANYGVQPKEKALTTATVPDANGQPMLKSVTPEELAQGVPTYVAPKEPKHETRGVDEQIAAASLAGDNATVQKLLATKAKISAAGRDPNARDTLVKVEHKDEATGKTVIEWLPKSQLGGRTFEKGTGATTQNRLASAQAVNQTGEDLIAKLSDPKYSAVVGPAMGRYGSVQEWVGNPPPELAELAGTIESYALANMGVHGMRSAQGAEAIKKLLSQKHTPESLIATIKGLNKFSDHFMQNEGMGGAKPATGGGVTVKAPDGKTYSFTSQAQADIFKKRAGIK